MNQLDPLVDWYRVHARDLPWRRTGTSPWAVLVSEFMLQQTPVSRVLPVWREWMARWPNAADLATASSADAVRAWGRLGYPRRAMRLHACAQSLVELHAGEVPTELDALLRLPGVGAYTARAVLAFAFGQRAAPVDVNVRRVLARAVTGVADAGPASTSADFTLLENQLPSKPATAAQMSAAVMELGATLCTVRAPRCDDCPLKTSCNWRTSGYPSYTGPARRRQLYEGTDRQARGRLLAVLRSASGPVAESDLVAAWPGAQQRERALSSLIADGLASEIPTNRYVLCDEGIKTMDSTTADSNQGVL